MCRLFGQCLGSLVRRADGHVLRLALVLRGSLHGLGLDYALRLRGLRGNRAGLGALVDLTFLALEADLSQMVRLTGEFLNNNNSVLMNITERKMKQVVRLTDCEIKTKCKLRSAKEPVAYLEGFARFLDLEFGIFSPGRIKSCF